MLKVEPTGQRGPNGHQNDRNGLDLGKRTSSILHDEDTQSAGYY